jgi:hypothetical protein
MAKVAVQPSLVDHLHGLLMLLDGTRLALFSENHTFSEHRHQTANEAVISGHEATAG